MGYKMYVIKNDMLKRIVDNKCVGVIMADNEMICIAPYDIDMAWIDLTKCKIIFNNKMELEKTGYVIYR